MGIYTGWPGSVYDACVLAFYKRTNASQLQSNTSRTINGGDVPVFVIGDSVYPMLPWLMKPYNLTRLDSDEKSTYNYRINQGHIVAEIVFGRVRVGCWNEMMCTLRISQLLHQQPVLHEIHGESFDESWEDDRSDLA